MDLLDKIPEWSIDEYAERETALNTPSSSLVKLVSSNLPDNYDLDFSNYSSTVVNFHYHIAALSALLSLLKFPPNLRPLLEAIIGMSMDEGSNEFSATDLELGFQMKYGKNSNSAAAKKDFSRKKKLFREWQEAKNFQIVKISGRRFDAKRRRNDPTQYQVFITEWAVKVVNKARKNVKDWRNRRNKAKAIRKAAIAVLYSLPECPPLEFVKTKTFTEEQLHNRDIKNWHNLTKRIVERLHRSNMPWQLCLEKLEIDLQMWKTNEPGTIGKMLTPEINEPQPEKSNWNSIKSGEMEFEIEELKKQLAQKQNQLENVNFDRVEYAAQVVQSEEREISAPRKWEDGKWSEFSNEIPLNELELPKGQNAESIPNSPETACKSLNPLDVEGTFLDKRPEDVDDG